MKRKLNRILACFLSAAMVICSTDVISFAAEPDNSESTEIIAREEYEESDSADNFAEDIFQEDFPENNSEDIVSEDEPVADDEASYEAGVDFLSTVYVDDVEITVTADAGVFPAGATACARKVTAGEEKEIEEAVDEKRDAGRNVARSYSFDISVVDSDGKEIEPDTEKGSVKVSFKMAEIADSNLETEVYHITETVDGLNAEDMDVDTEAGAADEAAVETDGFSYYTVEFTYGELQYVLEGGGQVELDTVMNAIGLEGVVKDVSFSSPQLVLVEKNDAGKWILTALQPFTSEEELIVSVAGEKADIEYIVKVTDEIRGGVNANWTAWTSGTSLPSNTGYFYLTKNVTLSTSCAISSGASVYLDLNGYTVSVANTTGIHMKYTSNLYLYDTSATGSGKITGAGQSAVWIDSSGACLTMYGGTMTGNNCFDSAGAVCVSYGKFYMYGGALSNNTSVNYGGAVLVSDGGAFYMYGGTISGNSSKYGGGVDLLRKASFHMSGGTISNNTANTSEGDGGGICLNDSSLYISGTALITSNNANRNGGGVSLYASTMSMSGGSICYNKAGSDGGGVLVGLNSKLTLTDGAIYSNELTGDGYGGGLGVGATGGASGSMLTMTGGAIYNNKGGRYGGGIAFVNSKSNVISGGLIYSNRTTKSDTTSDTNMGGGGIGITGASGVTLSGTTKIYNNTACNGGGIAMNGKSALTINGAEIGVNTATKSASGVNKCSQDTVSYTKGRFNLSNTYNPAVSGTSTVSFNANGGTGGQTTSKTVTYGNSMPTGITLPTRSGYHFNGYYNAAAGGDKYYNADGSGYQKCDYIGAVTLYAQWLPNLYTVIYDSNTTDSVENMPTSSTTMLYDADKNLSSNIPTREYYSFLGWSKNASATVSDWDAGEMVHTANSLTALDDEDAFLTNGDSVTLYAVWKIDSYTIDFDANGGTGAPDSQIIDRYEKAVEPTTVPKKTNFKFIGWTADSEALPNSELFDFENTEITENITLYGIWESHISHTWVFKSGTGSDSDTIYAYCSVDEYNCPYYGTDDELSQAITLSVKEPSAPLTYNGLDFEASVFDPSDSWATVFGSVPEITYEYKADEKETYSNAVSLANAGYYKASITTNGCTASTEYQIARKGLTLEADISNWNYKSEAVTPTLSGNEGNGAVSYFYKLSSADDSTYSAEVPTAVGDYTLKAVVAETGNYLSGEATKTFSILPIDRTETIVVSMENYTYETATVPAPSISPSSAELDEEPEAEFFYRAKGSVDAGTLWPASGSALDAGEYEMFAVIKATKSYKEVRTDSIYFEVLKREWEYVAPTGLADCTYDALAHDLVIPNAGNPTDAKFVYSYEEDGEFAENIPKETNVGEYTVYYKILSDKNHNESEVKSLSAKIDKAEWTVGEPERRVVAYNAEDQLLAEAGTVTDVNSSDVSEKLLYSLDGVEFSNVIPKASAVGNYTVFFKVEGDDNHEAYGPFSFISEIEKADRINLPTVVMPGYTFAATEDLPTPSLSENAAENPDAVFWYNTENSFTGAKEWKNISSTTLDAGTYYMFASLSETDSYKACTTNGTAFNIDKAEYTGQTEFPVSLIYCKDFEPKEIAKADLMPADAGEASVGFKYSSVDNVSGYKDCDVNPDGDAILMYFEKIDSYVENTSCSFTFSVSTTNYYPYDVYVIVTRCPCTHPETEVVTMHRTLPGCETYGEDYRLCTVCNVIVEDNISVNPLGHSYDADGICEREGCGIISIAEGTGFEISAFDLIYNGESKTPVFAVTYKGTELVKGTDYTVEYDAQTDLGRYEAVITGIGGYRGSVTYLWAIIPPQEGLWCEDIEDQIYTGKTIKPEVDVYCDGILLTPGTDYTIKYGKNNVKAADKDAVNKKNVSIAPSVTISGKGNYKGKITKTFSIRERDLSDAEVDDILVASTGKDIKLVTTVKVDGRKLKAGTDYYFSTSEDGSDEVKKLKEAGEYELFVIGKGNYTGAVSFTCSIVTTVPASKVSIAKIGNQKYNGGEAVEPAVKITYKKKDVTDKFDIEFENNTEVGTATVIVTAKEAGVAPANEVIFTGSRKATFKIVGTKISGAKLGEDGKGKIEECIYSGEECEPELGDIYLGKDKLTEDTDYAVEYANNINAGTATVIVTGKGGYVGTKKFSFKILPYDAAKEDSEVIVEGEDIPAVVSYEKGGAQFSPVIAMNGNALTPNKDYTVKYINNKAVAAYDDKNSKDKSIAPTVLITFKGNFTGKKTITYTIEAKEIGECNISIQDKVASTKAGSWKQKSFTITDVNGKKLAAKTDYDSKSVKYYSDEDCTQEIEDATLVPDTVVYVKVDGCKNFTGSIVGSYRISKINIKGAKVKVAAKEYTGAEITLDAEDLVVTIGSGKKKVTLDSTMYEIIPDSYRNNVKTGKASVVIKGIGDYCGTKTVKFSIKKKGFTWWKDLLKF